MTETHTREQADKIATTIAKEVAENGAYKPGSANYGRVWQGAYLGAVRAIEETAALELLKALCECRAQFDYYAHEHRKAEKHDKAATNERFAFLCSQAIARATGEAA